MMPATKEQLDDVPKVTWWAALKRFAGRPWYPWVVGALSGINIFALVLSGPLVVLFISGVLASPRRRLVGRGIMQTAISRH